MGIRTERRLSRLTFLAASIFAAVYILYGCATAGSGRLPSGGELSSDKAKSAALDEGRGMYMSECAQCHRRYRPTDRNPDEWKKILQRHRSRVPLTAEQFGKLEQYVIEASAHMHQDGK